VTSIAEELNTLLKQSQIEASHETAVGVQKLSEIALNAFNPLVQLSQQSARDQWKAMAGNVCSFLLHFILSMCH
jgi:hypothetical protein